MLLPKRYKRSEERERRQMMARYLTDEDVFRVLSEYYHHRTDIQRMTLSEAISRVPTADVVEKERYDRLLDNALIISEALREYQDAEMLERKNGKWKHGCCSECGYNWGKDAPIANVPNFCPNCGAKMKQEITDNIKEDDISWTDLRWYLSKEEKEYD